MPRRYKLGADRQPHRAFYGKLPEEFTREDTLRFMAETDLALSGKVSADTLALLHAEGYDYKGGNLIPAGKENPMEKGTGGTSAAPAAPLKLDVSVRVIEPNKNLMGFASVKFNDSFVVEKREKSCKARRACSWGCPASRTAKGATGIWPTRSQRSSGNS